KGRKGNPFRPVFPAINSCVSVAVSSSKAAAPPLPAQEDQPFRTNRKRRRRRRRRKQNLCRQRLIN
ncbi:MAG: hypothetical protein PHT11_11385, partial [Synergistaceae bacterium]|nr:hypothetical protein [Synergistaceae bacterium]